MLKKLSNFFHSMSFGQKLCLILILFALVPLLTIQQIMMHFYEEHIIDDTSNSTLSVVKANNQSVDMLLGGVETTSKLMIDSAFYYDIFSRLDELSVAECMHYDGPVSSEITKLFLSQPDAYDAYLYTSKWLFGPNTNLMPITPAGFQTAGFDELAKKGMGLPVWLTGYDYGERIGSQFLMDKESYDGQYPLTMLREMNFQYFYSGVYKTLPADAERPILVVHLLEGSLRELYKDSIRYEGSLYTIVNEEGIVVSSDNERFPIGQRISSSILDHFGESGMCSYSLDGEKTLLCYDTLSERGLFSFALVPMRVLLEETVSQTRKIQWVCAIALIALSAAVAFLLAQTITRPIQALTKASIRVAHSDFSANTPVPKGRDFKLLTESFNHMEHEINRLIHENYEISLREKETQLMALTMQINPHFLYNTLNTINMLAIENNDEETADLIVSLSEMLHYTFKDSSDKGLLSEEISWVSNYLYIMSRRYEGAFRTVMDIDEELVDAKIPKFILQPLMENSILHGFSDPHKDGVLTLSIQRAESSVQSLKGPQPFLCIQVIDNGKGMDEEELRSYLHAIHTDGHVGISNVHRRLALIYGENYHLDVKSAPGEGTSISIYIPCEM